MNGQKALENIQSIAKKAHQAETSPHIKSTLAGIANLCEMELSNIAHREAEKPVEEITDVK